jgi:hypothetical protein
VLVSVLSFSRLIADNSQDRIVASLIRKFTLRNQFLYDLGRLASASLHCLPIESTIQHAVLQTQVQVRPLTW